MVEKRRKEILNILSKAETPVSASALAGKFGVSRQVIVQDLAVIRAATPNIISTSRGYVMQHDTTCTREFKMQHREDEVEKELTLIVDLGGSVKNISVSHRIYGRITGEMHISSRQDVAEFMEAIKTGSSTLLGEITSGYHFHLIEAPSEERLNLIEEKLDEAGLIAPLSEWEMEQKMLEEQMRR